MARRIRARRRRGSGGLVAAMLMIGVFAAVALMQRLGGAQTGKRPAPTHAIETVSDTVRLGTQDYYAIQFGAYENAAAAQEKASEYVNRGAAGYIWRESGQYRVLAAVYTSLADAQTIKERLRAQGIEAYVYTIHRDALEMRVSASEAQRALLGQVFAFVERAAREIGDISMAIDKQTMTVKEAADRMELLHAEAAQHLSRVQTELGGDENGVIAGIETLLSGISTNCEEIFAQNLSEALAVTAKIKYNYLEVLWDVKHFVETVLALGTA